MYRSFEGWLFTQWVKPSRRLVLLVLPTFLISSCALLKVFESANSLASIQVVAEVNANQNTATAIDFLFVYDSDVLPLLPQNGPAWFAAKSALQLSLATRIEVVSVQVPPAKVLSVALPSQHSKAVGIYAFVNYLSVAGQPVGNLTPYRQMMIWLSPSTVTYKGE